MLMSDKIACSLMVAVFGGFILAVAMWPAEMKCATSYYVAPWNTAKACAQFRQEKDRPLDRPAVGQEEIDDDLATLS